MVEEKAAEKSSIVDSLMGAVQGYKAKEQSGSGAGWIGAAIAGILGLIGIAIFAFQAWKSGKELAKLKHEKAVREEEEHQAKVDIEIATNEDERQKAIQEADGAGKRIEALELERQRLEGEHREHRERIDAIASWDDVDLFLDGDS